MRISDWSSDVCSSDLWQSAEPFRALGKPTLFFGVTGGNMDSMVNRYTADRRLRHDDAYTPGGEGGRRPDRSEEHTSELQSLMRTSYAGVCLKKQTSAPTTINDLHDHIRY